MSSTCPKMGLAGYSIILGIINILKCTESILSRVSVRSIRLILKEIPTAIAQPVSL